MKISLAALCLLSFQAFAAPGYDCVSSETGLRYIVNTANETITVKEKNKIVVVEKYLRVSKMTYESNPPLYVTNYENKFGVIMEVSDRMGKITASFDDDEDLTCKEKK